MKEVKSSNISHIGYDTEKRLMSVKFKTGSIYRYEDVPPEAHEALVGADSVGSHFHENIRGKFIYTKETK